jgi:hypothetical protein
VSTSTRLTSCGSRTRPMQTPSSVTSPLLSDNLWLHQSLPLRRRCCRSMLLPQCGRSDNPFVAAVLAGLTVTTVVLITVAATTCLTIVVITALGPSSLYPIRWSSGGTSIYTTPVLYPCLAGKWGLPLHRHWPLS